MYTIENFKTKKALREAVAKWNKFAKAPDPRAAGMLTFADERRERPAAVRIYQPGPFGFAMVGDGWHVVEGPHCPEPHRWHAEVHQKMGVVVAVK